MARSGTLTLLLLLSLFLPATNGAAASGSDATSAESIAALPGAPKFPTALGSRLHAALAARRASPGNPYVPRTQHVDPDGTPLFTNRLFLESSPYLLQHAHNPVNWYPWGDEAFAEATRLGRPVLVSIGYSTCHWCHVMEEESFDDVATATYLNQNFIAIKVDREMRPDVDAIYMQAAHAITGSGGWPLNVWLTPEREPFYAGTYFPPQDNRGRPGFTNLLRSIAGSYATKPDEIARSARQLSAAIQESLEGHVADSTAVPSSNSLDLAFRHVASRFDAANGGVGRRPKFPSSLPLRFLLRYHRRTGNEEALAMARTTL